MPQVTISPGKQTTAKSSAAHTIFLKTAENNNLEELIEVVFDFSAAYEI